MTKQPTAPSARDARAFRELPLISATDIGMAFGLPLLALLAWTTPARAWRSLARAIAPYSGGVISRDQKTLQQRIVDVMGPKRCPDPGAVARELVASEILNGLQTMRDHLPGGWRPEIEFVGRRHIESALAAGNGAVIWDSHFYFANLVTKMALHRAGFRAHHLSHPTHGFSRTQFGVRMLNPMRTTAERRYLGERVMLEFGGAVTAMRRLSLHLKGNGIASITVRGAGLYPVKADFFDGVYTVATGAPDLSFHTGAPLIPTFTVRRDDGSFLVTAEAPIEVSATSRRDAAAAAVSDYVRRLEPYVLQYPGQWVDWINI